jgi:hypothetical protein
MPDYSDTRIQFRRGTANEWANASSVVLGVGEPGYDTTNDILKIGNGVDTWENLTGMSAGNVSVNNIETGNHFSLGAGPYSNWQPSQKADVVRVTTTADVIIHGLDASYMNKDQITINNFGTYTMTFKQDSATATSTNRFYNMPAGDLVLYAGDSATFTYDDVYDRWLVYGVGQATKIVTLSQAAYDALGSYDPNTLYIVT